MSAVPTEPPVCRMALTVAEPTPASRGSMPAVPRFIAAAVIRPMPSPVATWPGRTSATYEPVAVRVASQAMPHADSSIPVTMRGRPPILPSSPMLLPIAPIMVQPDIGMKARPVLAGL